MLMLTRNVGESIYIGDDIRLIVVSTSEVQVKIGIDAPREVPVNREEIYNSIKEKGEA